MRKYFKTFLLMALPFGSFFGVWSLFVLDRGFSGAVGIAIIAGTFFGMSMVVAFSFLGFVSGEGFAYGKTDWSHIFELKMDREEAEELCRRSLESLEKKTKPVPGAKDQPSITVRTSMTWRSFSEIICFKLLESTNGAVRIDISSRPRVSITKFDWGANRKNIEAICRFFERAVDPEKIIRSERIEPQ